MGSPRPQTLFLPVVGLLAAVLVLLTVVTVTTYFNVSRSGEQAKRVLEVQATAVVSGLAAGLRTGWRHWVWQDDTLEGLIQEMNRGDVAFIAMLDERGRVLAHTNPKLLGRLFKENERTMLRLDFHEVRGWFISEKLFLAGRKIRPDELPPPRPRLEDMRPGMMEELGPGMRMMLQRRGPLPENRHSPAVIMVGLKTDAYLEARKRQVLHALVMAGLLFVLGSAAIYFIFVVQNYRTIDRTLANLSTYTSGIVDNMPGGLVTVDSAGSPVMVNQAARVMFGWEDRPVKGLNRETAIAELCREFGPALERGETVIEREFEVQKLDGTLLPLAVSAAQVPAGEDGGADFGTVFILRDLRQIRALEDQVRQSEKLAAVGRLAAGVAHEVRNPLSSMRGLARFLARGLDEKSREAEYLKVMVDEIDRLNRVINGLLDFARPRQPNLESVSLNEVARHTSDLVTDDARHHKISLREDMAPQKPTILADRDMAIQAMLNVLLNAIEAMPDGGRLMISTKRNGNQGVFMVEDSGPGFDQANRSRLLDPFFTTKKKGTGLGLAQVAGIMEAHGGKIELGGEPGFGARVELSFPLAPPEADEEA